MERIIDFTECGHRIIKTLKKYKPKIIKEPTSDYPVFTVTFEGKNLKRWKMGIWATGKWSDFYDIDSDTSDCVCVFLKHDWNIDKFRPSCAEGYRYDISFHDFTDFTDYHLGILERVMGFINNNPKCAYFLDTDYLPEKKIWRQYLNDWWNNVVRIPFSGWWKRRASVKLLYRFLKFISWVDPRIDCSKTMLFDEGENCYPRYTIGFCASIKASLNADKLYGAWRLYTQFPAWLQIHTGHSFSAHWNLCDQNGDENEKELRLKIWKGIYFTDVEDDKTETYGSEDTNQDNSTLSGSDGGFEEIEN